MDIIAAYREAGTYRGAAEIAGTTHKTVRRVIARQEAGGAASARVLRGRNYDGVTALVAERVKKTLGRISAKRLLPAARAAGYQGSDRNFRRLVAEQKALWRREHHRGRRPAVWSPGEHLVIDWGAEGGLHVFCAVLAWCRFRFVRFAADERADTTLALLAECFEVLGGVPGKVLADRMGCLKGAVVAWSPCTLVDSFPLCRIYIRNVNRLLKAHRTHFPQAALFPDAVVIPLDVVEYRGPGLFGIQPQMLVDELFLDRGVK